MARNGTGTYSLLANSWNPAVNGVNATAADWQALINDVAAAITQSVSTDGQAPMTGNLAMGNNKVTGLMAGTANTDAVNFGQISSSAGQCVLVKSGANLVLQYFQGNRLTINGVVQAIPSAGVFLSPTGAVATTNYYIYAYMNAGLMTLEYSTTGHATDISNGVEIKSGDPTRTLVGLARAVTGPAWADSTAQRFVASWFNPIPRYVVAAFSTNRTTASSTFVEVNTEIRCEWVQFANTPISMGLSGYVTTTTGSGSTGIALDAVLIDGASAATGTTPQPVVGNLSTVTTEGYHYVTLVGTAGGGGGTVSYSGGVNAASVRTSLQGTIGR